MHRSRNNSITDSLFTATDVSNADAMIRIACFAFVLLFGLPVPVKCGPFEDGEAAYDRRDYATAWKLWRPLAEEGHASAQGYLGYMYETGKGVPRDDEEAVKWYRKAAEQGNAPAQANLGAMYESGRGISLDYVEALKWYRTAAQQGNAAAQSKLDNMNRQGLGVRQDYVEILKWNRKLAEQGDAVAQTYLGFVLYSRGGLQDHVEAAEWYRKAAEQGHVDAQTSLGFMYANGFGVPSDFVQAYIWSSVAAASGGNMAQENMRLFANYMTPDQITEAQRMAQEWMADHRQ
jgi:TPR repeat protein